MKTGLAFKPYKSSQNFKPYKASLTSIQCQQIALERLNDALKRSVGELLLLAKFYQKHGRQKQAQEIYYYILSLQDRRDEQAKNVKVDKLQKMMD